MMTSKMPLGRRDLLLSGLAAVACGFVSRPAEALIGGTPAMPHADPRVALMQSRMAPVPASPLATPTIVQEALAALSRHGRSVRYHDRIAIVDFSVPSSRPRMQVVDIESGRTSWFLVSHGVGSDPRHTGYLQRFSNVPNSNASSQGAFVTGDYYYGQHGRSQRLMGLDATNNKAFERAIVIHGAWYANAQMITAHGKLGRSQGCFAVGEGELARLFDRLGQGRMIYSAKV